MAHEPRQAVLWDQARAAQAGAALPAGLARTRVAVVGGGFTGLSAALSLAERGHEVMLLEAGRIGQGASGRNGGQVVPGLKPDPQALGQRYGQACARRMLDFGFSAADYAFALIRRHGIACGATRNGWIQTAVGARGRERLQRRAQALLQAGAQVRYLDAGQVAQASGSDYYCAGLDETGAGAVQPVQLALGLARAAARAGARLYEDAPVTGLQPQGGGWRLQAGPGASVQADAVVLAADVYVDRLWPRQAASMLQVASAQIASEVLPPGLAQAILPRRAGISEARKLTVYCRISPDGRFLIGGRARHTPRVDAATIGRLRRAAVQRFPALAALRWDYAWHGRVGLTRDDAPRLCNPAPGLWTAYGFGGRGVALALRFGPTLAQAAAGAAAADLDYPVTPLSAIPWHAVSAPAVSAGIFWHRLRDAIGYPA
ncbi:FAD-dependent oxidoreductase [Orrella sp. JC864]|uniref:NAD(P)/FAD-dependent oxidoreductase n=1 Tax=Orrella sp. JC864 TaxID=3120298 RepID=UPI0012BBFD81